MELDQENIEFRIDDIIKRCDQSPSCISTYYRVFATAHIYELLVIEDLGLFKTAVFMLLMEEIPPGYFRSPAAKMVHCAHIANSIGELWLDIFSGTRAFLD